MTRDERAKARTRKKVNDLAKLLADTQRQFEQAQAQQAADDKETRDKLRYEGGVLLDELRLLHLPKPVLRELLAEAARLLNAGYGEGAVIRAAQETGQQKYERDKGIAEQYPDNGVGVAPTGGREG
jgi:hypothetical protein